MRIVGRLEIGDEITLADVSCTMTESIEAVDEKIISDCILMASDLLHNFPSKVTRKSDLYNSLSASIKGSMKNIIFGLNTIWNFI